VLPLIVDEAVATLAFHLLPGLLAEPVLQKLEEGFVDEDRAAETT
jgi:hypothetical protein